VIDTIHAPSRPDAPGTTTPQRVLGVLADGVVDRLGVLRKLETWALDAGLRADSVAGTQRARAKLSEAPWDLVFVMLGERPVTELAASMEAVHAAPGTPRVVALTERPSMETVIHAESLGVDDVLTLPLKREDVMRLLRRRPAPSDDVVIPLPAVSTEAAGRFAMVGEHQSMLEIYRVMGRVAPTSATVLIVGEPGTGREMIARCLHAHSPVSTGPFVAVNCRAVPEDQLEAELFGSDRANGTHGGNGGTAQARRIGRFEQANGGTIFLDDIAELTPAMQARLLRAVQEREIERVGGSEVIKVDVRIIASTAIDLRRAIAEGRFRGDLYYRLAIVTIRVPRLADRGGDLLLLTAHFVKQSSRLGGQPRGITGISSRALEALQGHTWTANVRELRNVVEHAVVTSRDRVIRLEDLPEEIQVEARTNPRTLTAQLPSLAEMEARHIAEVLEHTGGVIHTAAEILGIHRNTLARKVKEYHL
jgi:DNA-binding NtrC family response regulator